VASLLGWCYRERLISDDLAEALVLPPVKDRIQRTLSTEEIQTLLKTCDLNTSKGIRDAAIVSLLGDSGLRSHELRRLTLNNVHVGVKVDDTVVNIAVVIGKGGNEEIAFFGKKTAQRVQTWRKIRRDVSGVDNLFISIGGSTPGQPFTRDGLRTTMVKLGKKAGIAGVTPHSLRRSFACIADEAGATTRKIQVWGRWMEGY
jgi:site-specific recombinase XerD